MSDQSFGWIFLAGLILGGVIRSYYGRQYRKEQRDQLKKEKPAVLTLMALWGVAQLLPLFYLFSPWLDFADLRLPAWAGWLGSLIFAAGVWLLWRSHVDLAHNWSPTLEIQEDHTLVTDGVYRFVRHPMYTAHLLWGIGQLLLIHNWIAGPAGLITFIPLYLLRAPDEEEMMLKTFGQEYRNYMDHTGGLIPRL